ncbi:acyl-CoA carboxylase epsilon subunit [Streptomyces sp. NPDC048416]|uniref:acyl-CoA carboxylase epsilon subunit n=1 Tax=Streptomyces sp. NPDC048416 TaxID=3365546 RepID=UPI003721520E
MIKVVRGNPTPEELAAALAVVQARAAATASATSGAPTPPEGWSDPSRITGRALPRPGVRAWARTYWPA